MAHGKPFHFTIAMPGEYVLRTVADAKSGEERRYLVIEGIASDAGEDALRGQMTPECVLGMIATVNDRGQHAPIYRNVREARAADAPRPVGVDIDHSDKTLDQIGFVARAWAINREDLTPELIKRGVVAPAMGVEVWINLDKPHGMHVKAALDDGDQLGFSIYGKVADHKVVRSAKDGKPVEQFRSVLIEKVAVTAKPANPRAMIDVLRRSLIGAEMDPEEETTPEETVAEQVVETPAPVEEEAAPVREETPEAAEPVVPTVPAFVARDFSHLPDPNGDTFDAEALADIAGLGAPVPAAGAVPAPREAADVVVTQETPLAQATMSRLAAIAAESAAAVVPPAPAPAPAPETPSPATPPAPAEVPEEVFRALDSRFDERYVSRAALDAILDQVAAVLEPIPAYLKALNERLTVLEQTGTPQGRGTVVLRSLLDGNQVPADQRPEMDEPTRLQAMEALSRGGRPDLAAALAMGWLGKEQLPR